MIFIYIFFYFYVLMLKIKKNIILINKYFYKNTITKHIISNNKKKGRQTLLFQKSIKAQEIEIVVVGVHECMKVIVKTHTL
jgi:hypothetical protein